MKFPEKIHEISVKIWMTIVWMKYQIRVYEKKLCYSNNKNLTKMSNLTLLETWMNENEGSFLVENYSLYFIEIFVIFLMLFFAEISFIVNVKKRNLFSWDGI